MRFASLLTLFVITYTSLHGQTPVSLSAFTGEQMQWRAKYGTGASFEAYYKLNYHIDNNKFDLKKYSVEDNKPKLLVNIFFNYYKNSVIATALEDGAMIFSIGYQYIIQLNMTETSVLKFDLPSYSNKDHIDEIKGAIVSSTTFKKIKIKKKYIKFNETQDNFQIVIDESIRQPGDILVLYSLVESFDFKSLRTPAWLLDDVEHYSLSYNIPDVFSYKENVSYRESEPKTSNNMVLKHFTTRSPPIVDYTVSSRSGKYNFSNLLEFHEASFDLLSINIPIDLGTTSEKILKFRGD